MRKHSWFTIIALLSLLWVVPAPAQSQDDKPKVVITHQVITEKNALSVEAYFSVRYDDGRAVPVNEISSTVLDLKNGEPPVQAVPQDPTTPIKIAIVLDQSGSMANFIELVKQAANQAIDQAPAGAQIAVFTFTRVGTDDIYIPAKDFTDNREEVKKWINENYQSISGGETCLYTAAYKATDYLLNTLKPEERRAIVLFTDGKDDNGNGGQCSDRNVIDVTSKAGPSQGTKTPIYTIGLCALNCESIQPEFLGQISRDTQAISVVGTRDQMNSAFITIMDSIKNQKYTSGFLRPCVETQVTLEVQLISGDTIAGIIPLGAHKCYTPTVSEAKIANLNPLPENQKYTFNFSTTNTSPVNMVGVELQVLGPNQTLVYTQPIAVSISPQETKTIPMEMSDTKLSEAGKYTLQVLGYSSDGFTFRIGNPSQRSEILAQEAFNHTPIPITFEIRSNPVVDYTNNVIRLDDVEITDEQKIIDPKFTYYKVRLLREDVQVFESERIQLDPTNPKIAIPLASIPQELIPTEQQSQLNMQIILETSNVRPIESPIKSFLFPVKPKEPFLKRYGVYVLIALVIIAIGAGFWYLWRNRKPKAGNVPMPYNPPTQAFNRIDLPGVNPAARQNPNQQQQQQQQSAVRPPPNSAANQPARYNSPASSANASIPTAHFDGGMPDNGATMIYTPPVSQGRQQQLNVRVVQTPDRSQLQNQTITMFPCTIGRSEASVIITGDKLLSRQHVEISLIGGQFYVADLSKNGLFINEQRQQANTPIQLRLPTTIRLGQDTYIELSQ
ncbi:FHA domain-containing protein [Herpetosiphon sp. NSE202]|uniref:FHA domain-containing protein n=1 Tax=Herpetosiphon sp. NSE202 TaxID=3351349 RepID=UPI00363F1855